MICCQSCCFIFQYLYQSETGAISEKSHIKNVDNRNQISWNRGLFQLHALFNLINLCLFIHVIQASTWTNKTSEPFRVQQKLPSNTNNLWQTLLNDVCAFKSPMSHSTCLSLSLICLLASAVLSAEKSKDIFSFTSMGLEEEIPSSHCWLSSQCSED